MKKKPNKKHWLLGGIGFFVVCLLIWQQQAEQNIRWIPDYDTTDITPFVTRLAQGDSLTDEEYGQLFNQTGIGVEGVARLLQADRIEDLDYYQSLYFHPLWVDCVANSILSREEFFVDAQGERVGIVPLVPLEPGDILLTPNSHCFGWRQGHAAIVIDEETTLESVVLGSNSVIQWANKWTAFPAVMVLRFAENSDEIGTKAAEIAVADLNDVPYDLTVGVLSAKDVTEGVLTGTHCAHLVWQCFARLGIDIDSNGGKIVTPQEIATSPHLEVVQMWGIDPDKMWN